MSQQIIKNRYNNNIIYQGDHVTLKDAVEYCVQNNANLSNANLGYADLRCADLSGANLKGANLSNANLSNADLINANLSNANLRSADLRFTNLIGVNLTNADLRSAKYSILQILRLNIGETSDNLTLELMRWDAITCGMDLMNEWSRGDICPFNKGYKREFYFKEVRELWIEGLPTMNHKQLWEAVAKEKGIKI